MCVNMYLYCLFTVLNQWLSVITCIKIHFRNIHIWSLKKVINIIWSKILTFIDTTNHDVLLSNQHNIGDTYFCSFQKEILSFDWCPVKGLQCILYYFKIKHCWLQARFTIEKSHVTSCDWLKPEGLSQSKFVSCITLEISKSNVPLSVSNTITTQ